MKNFIVLFAGTLHGRSQLFPPSRGGLRTKFAISDKKLLSADNQWD